MPPILSKPWSVADFERMRPHLTNFCKEEIVELVEDPRTRRIVIRAPVKSGKREIAEYMAMRDSVGREPRRVHVFISAWHRTADEDQREELRTQNMKVFSISTKKKADECKSWILSELRKGHLIVAHLDEADHGCGSRQILCSVWTLIRNNPSITCILYTATPEEILFSGEVDDAEYQELVNEMFKEAHIVEYTPPLGYCGPQKFLSENLVHVALPFFHKEGGVFGLCQGVEIIEKLRQDILVNPSRNIIVLRLSGGIESGTRAQRKENKAIHQFLRNVRLFPQLEGVLVYVDKDAVTGIRYPGVITQKIDWSTRLYWDGIATGRPMIIVVDQTSSRSTEWSCHDRVHTYHDFRNVVQFSTISQAQERVNHYDTKYAGGFQRILVYGHHRTFMLSAGNIDYDTYLKDQWKKRKINGTELYKVKNSDTDALHPMCPPDGISEDVADHLLQELECYADVSLAARVAGGVRIIPNYKIRCFMPCTPDTCNQVLDQYKADYGIRTRLQNPFDDAFDHRIINPDGTCTFRGQHRGWKVIEKRGEDLYQQENGVKLDLGSTGGNRNKICYQDGDLGIAFIYQDGVVRRNTLRTSGSMYGNE